MANRLLRTSLLGLTCLVCACDKTSQQVAEPDATRAETVAPAVGSDNFWQQGTDALTASAAAAKTLQAATQALLDAPSEDTLAAAKQQWRAVHLAWQKFYFASQLATTLPSVFEPISKLLFHVGAQPIQPGYLDYFGPYPYSGLVHDISIPLDAETLVNQHGMTDSEELVLGIYAVEFMLAGENGGRPASDYSLVSELSSEAQAQGFRQTSELPNNRRRELLGLQTRLLAQDLSQLLAHWRDPGPDALRSQWQTMPADARQAAILSTLERATAQLLLEFVEHTPTTEGASISAPESLSVAIQSLASGADWVITPPPAEVEQCLEDVATALAEVDLRSEWQASYANFRACTRTDAPDAANTTNAPATQEEPAG